MNSISIILAGFMSPIDIPTSPASMLWMFPLILSIAIVYKATKLRVIFPKIFIKEVVVLFLTISIFLILAGVGLNILVAFITS
ncbi:MAG: hypothetical protein FVQ82_11160 [Planctomycetes bacterium]|nr:hypothetical protein [Planctomycetota bacterium]